MDPYALPSTVSASLIELVYLTNHASLKDGGGHSVFGALYDPSVWMNTNNNGFVVVEMQYRLGAFGFLASPEVKKGGRLNTGLLDQRFAIEWTRKHISKFGGDPNRITVGGESSGAASAVFHALAYGGKETGLFDNVRLSHLNLLVIH
jgi:carboxylesterase type B